jgi:transposase
MRSKGTAQELEARRRLAVQKVADGWSQTDVAAFLGVHPVTVNKWVRAYRATGEDGLTAKPTPGRPRFLTPDQEARVLGWLTDKPTEHGFRTDLWTAGRVATLIERRFGVRFHPHYLRAWLRDRGYTPQKPARRPRQRDQAAIDRWLKEDWPRIKKRSAGRTPTSS